MNTQHRRPLFACIVLTLGLRPSSSATRCARRASSTCVTRAPGLYATHAVTRSRSGWTLDLGGQGEAAAEPRSRRPDVRASPVTTRSPCGSRAGDAAPATVRLVSAGHSATARRPGVREVRDVRRHGRAARRRGPPQGHRHPDRHQRRPASPSRRPPASPAEETATPGESGAAGPHAAALEQHDAPGRGPGHPVTNGPERSGDRGQHGAGASTATAASTASRGQHGDRGRTASRADRRARPRRLRPRSETAVAARLRVATGDAFVATASASDGGGRRPRSATVVRRRPRVQPRR